MDDSPEPDAADRLLLDESSARRAAVAPGGLVVIGDVAGALALGATRDTPTGRVRVHQDSFGGTRTITTHVTAAGLDETITTGPLDAALLAGATTVLLRLPRSLRELDDIAARIAAHAAAEVVVFAGGRVKHMSLGMNDVLRAHFGTLDISHARQKSRVLIARVPLDSEDPTPRMQTHQGIVVAAFGGAFADTGIDLGTRLLLDVLPDPIPADTVIDFACGTGVIGAVLAQRNPDLRIVANDDSALAAASARATTEANGLTERISVLHADGLDHLDPGSASFVTLNPPFHAGSALDESIAPRLFADAARALRPGGELWTVWNSPLGYRPALERIVGPTRQIARNTKFTVTASSRR